MCLHLWPQLHKLAGDLLACYPLLTPGFHRLQFRTRRISLTLMLGDPLSCYRQLLVCGDNTLEQQLRNYHVDAWFLNDLAPTNNPALWHKGLLATLGLLSKKTTTLTTLTTAKQLTNELQAAGFQVSKKCAAAGLPDFTYATFDQSSPIYSIRQTPWHIYPVRKIKTRQAIIVGAGLAGCYTAHVLAERGWSVTVLDAGSHAGCGASANRQAVLYPQLSAYHSPLTEFMLSAFLFAVGEYKKILHQQPQLGELSGIVQLAYNEKEQVAQAGLQSWLAHYPQLARLVDQNQASTLAGIALSASGLYIPDSGWFDAQALCQFLLKHPAIEWRANTHVSALSYHNERWHVDKYTAEVVVIANGYQAGQFAQTSHLPLKAIRGQMTTISSNHPSSYLQIPVCADAYILPAQQGTHTIGATYHSVNTDAYAYGQDDAENLAKLSQLSANTVWSMEIVSNWVGIRAATPDYLPLVGPVADADSFRQQFAGLASNSKRWIPLPGVFYPGLYICAGFGSRGLTSIPLSVEWLAALINNEPGFLPTKLVQAISPARFLRKEIVKR